MVRESREREKDDDLKSGCIWRFEIPVTEDVEKAGLKGLSIPEKEFRELEKKEMDGRGLS
jgi:hypothetical protein